MEKLARILVYVYNSNALFLHGNASSDFNLRRLDDRPLYVVLLYTCTGSNTYDRIHVLARENNNTAIVIDPDKSRMCIVFESAHNKCNG